MTQGRYVYDVKCTVLLGGTVTLIASEESEMNYESR